jgi:hypothetical protein
VAKGSGMVCMRLPHESRAGRRTQKVREVTATFAAVDDVTASLSARDGCPAVLLEPADRDRCWRLGPGEGKVARSTATGLLGWLTGGDRDVRVITPHGGLPAVPRWL